ncbi:MAG: acyl carrier protein [Oscillospiraceae bacterium]|jgi:acyl carrier protein|nr:acyl carrier protein [Oscillospiraceae bacterium]
MFEKIVEIISAQLKADPENILPATSVTEDLGADSLDVVELLMAIDEEFGVNVPDEDIPSLKTVQDIVDYVEAHRE